MLNDHMITAGQCQEAEVKYLTRSINSGVVVTTLYFSFAYLASDHTQFELTLRSSVNYFWPFYQISQLAV